VTHRKAGKERQLAHRRGGRGSSINHSILSELKYREIHFEGCKKKSFALHSGCRKTCSDVYQHSGYFKIAMGKNYVDLPPVWLLVRPQQHGFDRWLFKFFVFQQRKYCNQETLFLIWPTQHVEESNDVTVLKMVYAPLKMFSIWD
jgi:hypothetical protein